MFKGISFFIKKGWQYDKCYILWNVFYQLLNSLIPPITAIIPKLIIDELQNQEIRGMPYFYVVLLVSSLFLIQILSVYFYQGWFYSSMSSCS